MNNTIIEFFEKLNEIFVTEFNHSYNLLNYMNDLEEDLGIRYFAYDQFVDPSFYIEHGDRADRELEKEKNEWLKKERSGFLSEIENRRTEISLNLNEQKNHFETKFIEYKQILDEIIKAEEKDIDKFLILRNLSENYLFFDKKNKNDLFVKCFNINSQYFEPKSTFEIKTLEEISGFTKNSFNISLKGFKKLLNQFEELHSKMSDYIEELISLLKKDYFTAREQVAILYLLIKHRIIINSELHDDNSVKSKLFCALLNRGEESIYKKYLDVITTKSQSNFLNDKSIEKLVNLFESVNLESIATDLKNNKIS